MGLSEERFWSLNPKLLEPYIAAKRIKMEEMNFQSWLTGKYVFEGVSIALGNWSSKKGSRARAYPKKPHEIFEPTPQQKEAKAHRERQKAIAFFTGLEIREKAKAQIKK